MENSVGAIELAYGLKRTAEIHFRSVFGKCDAVEIRAKESNNDEEIVEILIHAGECEYTISVKKERP